MPASSGQPLQNIIWLVGERAARAVVTATVLGLVARHLAPGGFGQLNFAITFVAVAAPLATLGLDSVVIDELIRRPQTAGAVLGTALRLRLLAGVITGTLLAFFGIVFPSLAANTGPLIAVVALILIAQPAEVVDLWFQRHLDSRRTVLVRLVAVLAGATLKLVLVWCNASVVAFAWAQVADAALIAFGLTWAAPRSPHRSGAWTWDAEIARVLWRRGAPLALSALTVTLALRLDQLLVRRWLGESEGGIYFAAARLTEVALFVGTAVTLSLFPALAASRSRSTADYRAHLQKLFDAVSALGWIVALGCTFFGPLVVRLLYGPAYAAAAPVLIVQSWAALFALSAGARWQFILLSAPTLLNVAAAGLHIAVVCALGPWLTGRSGLTGAAATWLAAVVVSGYLTTWLFPPLRACAGLQTRGLLIPIAPSRWRSLLKVFRPEPAPPL